MKFLSNIDMKTIDGVILFSTGNYYNGRTIEPDHIEMTNEIGSTTLFSNYEMVYSFESLDEGIKQFIQIIESSIKLNKDMPLSTYDYLIRKCKGLRLTFVERTQIPNPLLTDIDIGYVSLKGSYTINETKMILQHLGLIK